MAPASTIQTQRRAKSTCPSSDRPARLDCSPRTGAVDHEGVITQRTALIGRGVVTGFYHNLISAAQFDAISTGNGYRDLINPSAPTNVRVAIGQANLSDMLKNLDVQLGLYNLFDVAYEHPGFIEHQQDMLEQDGRTFAVKLTYRF